MIHGQARYLLPVVLLVGCKPQAAPPLSKQDFAAAKLRCGLAATTYTYRTGVFIDEPLVDFTGEAHPRKSHDCFVGALDKLDQEATERGVTHISRVWEYRF